MSRRTRRTRRHGTLVVAAATASLVAVACGPGSSGSGSSTPGAAVAPDAACGPAVTPPMQDGGHLIGDTAPPVPYSSSPPTSGWHASGAPRLGFFAPDDPLTEPQIVSALEAGHTVVAYDPARLDAAVIAEIETLVTARFDGEVTATPYADADDPIALAAWGTLRGCGSLDASTIETFVAEHADVGEGH